MAKSTCPVCRRLLPSAVRLWDGRRYCRMCVDVACPGLASFAGENPVLELVLPRIKFWRTYLSLLFVMNAMTAAWFGIPMAWFSVVDPDRFNTPLSTGLAGVAVFMAAVSILATLMAFGVCLYTLFSRGRMTITSGQVEIDSGALAVEDQLSEISFCIVPAENLGWLRHPNQAGAPAVLVVSPRVPEDWRSFWSISFQLDEPALARWTAFLRLAGVDVVPPPIAPTRHRTLSDAAFVLFGFPIGVIVWLSATVGLRDLLVACSMDGGVAGVFAATVLLIGFALLFFWEVVRRGAAYVAETGSPFRMAAPLPDPTFKWKFGAGVAFLMAVTAVPSPIGWPAFAAFVAVWFAMGWVFGWSIQGKERYFPR